MPRDPLRAIYVDTLQFLFDQREAPTAAMVADFLESHEWQGLDPAWKGNIVARLRAWPDARPYPLIPEDDVLEAALDDASARDSWITPGSLRGDLVTASRRALRG